MQYGHFLKKAFVTAALGLSAVSGGSQAWADGATKAEPLALRRIMQELGKNMQTVTDGISHEDWALVARVAPQIAEHPQPPVGEKLRILSFIGIDTAKFKGYDEKTHHAARTLEAAAARNDGADVIAGFANLQNSCLACHQSFRKSFVENFYGKN